MARLASERYDMSVKIKVMKSRESRVEVHVRRPKWQEFLQY
jgi:hypothetical protein